MLISSFMKRVDENRNFIIAFALFNIATKFRRVFNHLTTNHITNITEIGPGMNALVLVALRYYLRRYNISYSIIEKDQDSISYLQTFFDSFRPNIVVRNTNSGIDQIKKIVDYGNTMLWFDHSIDDIILDSICQYYGFQGQSWEEKDYFIYSISQNIDLEKHISDHFYKFFANTLSTFGSRTHIMVRHYTRFPVKSKCFLNILDKRIIALLRKELNNMVHVPINKEHEIMFYGELSNGIS